MGIETIPWDAADYLDSEEMVIAYLEAVFEGGDPALIAAALNDVARAAWRATRCRRTSRWTPSSAH